MKTLLVLIISLISLISSGGDPIITGYGTWKLGDKLPWNASKKGFQSKVAKYKGREIKLTYTNGTLTGISFTVVIDNIADVKYAFLNYLKKAIRKYGNPSGIDKYSIDPEYSRGSVCWVIGNKRLDIQARYKSSHTSQKFHGIRFSYTIISPKPKPPDTPSIDL